MVICVAKAKTSLVLETTDYAAFDFNDPKAPTIIATHNITSCVIILLKNLNDKKECGVVGMAHCNLSNVLFDESAKENLTNFINAFVREGGKLESMSCQLLGGSVPEDEDEKENRVRARIKYNLGAIFRERGIKVEIKEPQGCQTDNRELENKKVGQVMSLAVDKDGTYIRKVTLQQDEKETKILKTDFNSDAAKSVMGDENISNVIPIDRKRNVASMGKTQRFFECFNKGEPGESAIKILKESAIMEDVSPQSQRHI